MSEGPGAERSPTADAADNLVDQYIVDGGATAIEGKDANGLIKPDGVHAEADAERTLVSPTAEIESWVEHSEARGHPDTSHIARVEREKETHRANHRLGQCDSAPIGTHSPSTPGMQEYNRGRKKVFAAQLYVTSRASRSNGDKFQNGFEQTPSDSLKGAHGRKYFEDDDTPANRKPDEGTGERARDQVMAKRFSSSSTRRASPTRGSECQARATAVEQQCQDSMHASARYGDTVSLALHIESMVLEAEDRNGMRALHFAAAYGQSECVE